MADGYVAIAGNENGHVDGRQLCHVYERPDECLQITAEPVIGDSDVQRRRSKHLREPGRQ